MPQASGPTRTVLFLQGPLSGLYARIGDHLRDAGCRVRRVNLCVGDQLHWRRPGARAFRGPVAAWGDWVERFVTEQQVTDLVLHGDRRVYHRIAAERARARGVRVFATELGYLRPDWMTLERDATGAGSAFPRDPDAIRRLAAACPPVDLVVRYPTRFWRVAAPDVLYNLANVALRPLFPHYRRHTLDHPLLDYAGAGWRLLRARPRERRAQALGRRLLAAGTPFYLLPLQLDGDLQIREHSRFSGMGEVVGEVVASFARSAPPGSHLVVKAHPLENGLRRPDRATRRAAEALGVAGRVHYMDGATLAPLLPRARGMVTVNSSVGIEAMRAGCPVLALSPAVYRVPGLTFQGPLDRFWGAAGAPDAGLVEAFVRALAGTVQVRGSIYHPQGQEVAARGLAQRILAAAAELHGEATHGAATRGGAADARRPHAGGGAAPASSGMQERRRAGSAAGDGDA